MATFKHISSKNADYGAAEQYLTFEHDEFTMKPTLDENERLIPRDGLQAQKSEKARRAYREQHESEFIISESAARYSLNAIAFVFPVPLQ